MIESVFLIGLPQGGYSCYKQYLSGCHHTARRHFHVTWSSHRLINTVWTPRWQNAARVLVESRTLLAASHSHLEGLSQCLALSGTNLLIEPGSLCGFIHTELLSTVLHYSHSRSLAQPAMPFPITELPVCHEAPVPASLTSEKQRLGEAVFHIVLGHQSFYKRKDRGPRLKGPY